MEQSQTSIEKFYLNHSKTIRITPRNLNIISKISYWITGKVVMDVGCGNKFITTCISIYTKSIDSIDMDEDITKYRSDKQYDVVTCFDVLEHVSDIDSALHNILLLCKPNGLMIFNQPEQCDVKQPIDHLVPLDRLMLMGKLIYLENYRFSAIESYNFMVFKK